ncbi:MAG: MFS transporter [Deltaproteobacteria bacterium]
MARNVLLSSQFLLIGATNFSLFLVLSAWSFLPLFIVELGGNKTDTGLIMGSIGIATLGSLPIITPLIDRYGRKVFIVGGAFLAGISNAGFLLFETYSPLMICVRLLQGVAFAACFNACSTAVVDLVAPEHRAQGIGLFGVSSSLAVAAGPYLGERVLLAWGFHAYFLLLIAFGLIGFFTGLLVKDPAHKVAREKLSGFFSTALRDRHLSMMTMAAVFGAGFGAMTTFFPLFAQTQGLRSGMFFVCYGVSLLVVRVFLGSLADRIEREKIILGCLTGFGSMLVLTSGLSSSWHTFLLGALFGSLQGLSYPAMMAQIVDTSTESNRAVVVGLFTGSFGVGINASLLLWGYIANLKGLGFMYLMSGILMFLAAAVAAQRFLAARKRSS